MSETLTCALIQTELQWENAQANLDHFSKKIELIEEVDLIVLPEMFSTGFSMNPEPIAEQMNGKSVSWMKETAKSKGAVLLGSLIIEEDGNYFNRLVIAHPSGDIQTYDKKHLFTLAGEDKKYTAGSERLLVEIKGWKILPLVCYDLRFPVWARSRKSEESTYEYDMLIYVANWPAPRVHAWDALLKARAIENQAYCIGLNRCGTDANGHEYLGHSALYDYAGIPVGDLKSEDTIGLVSISKKEMTDFREKFAFQNDGDDFRLL